MKERWLMSTAVFTAMFTLSFAQDGESFTMHEHCMLSQSNQHIGVS